MKLYDNPPIVDLALQPSVLREMQYQTPGLGYFPLLRGKVRHLITWGPEAQNMSGIVGADKVWGRSRTQIAMARLEMAIHTTMRIAPNDNAPIQIQEVTSNMFERRQRGDYELETGANFIYTTSPDITLMVKPGDCAVSIIKTQLPDGTPLLGLMHAGRRQLDTQLPRDVLTHLKSLGCDPNDTFIGIAPSILTHNYIPRLRRKSLRNFSDWEKHDRLKVKPTRIYLDNLGYFVDQLTESGIPMENIQAYAIDTFNAARQPIPEGFSHRYSRVTLQPRKEGRFLVAAQLQ